MASRVGKYLLFETLGEGAFGKVKLGVHEESGEQVAVKIMDKSDIKAQEMTMNVRREIAIMKALKHRNIVNLRQVLTSQSKLYIVMDLVTGGELFNEILKGKLEETVARRYFQQLVDGIEYCHRRGVCHRDLKPENLLIDETTGELKITDFGLSAMKGASTTEELLHTQCGSPNYCAPEIIARHKQGYSGNKVDAWSCGIILFALLAGFLPFYDENTKVLYRMIQRDDVKFPRKFPPEAKDLVLRLLLKEPEKRYTLAEVKKHPWFAVDYDGDDSTPKTTNSGTSPPVSRRKRRGHSRKSSVDQAPRSREFVPRKKSDKSDSDSGAQSVARSLPPAPPPVSYPVPPPVVMDSSSRAVPLSQRPPAPPSAGPPKPRSPLPPLPIPPPTTTSKVPVVHPPVPPRSVPPPPPPPPAVVPLHPSTHGGAVSARPLPPYPTAGIVRRKSREAREAQAHGIASAAVEDSNATSSVIPSETSGGALPSYSSLAETSGTPLPVRTSPTVSDTDVTRGASWPVASPAVPNVSPQPKDGPAVPTAPAPLSSSPHVRQPVEDSGRLPSETTSPSFEENVSSAGQTSPAVASAPDPSSNNVGSVSSYSAAEAPGSADCLEPAVVSSPMDGFSPETNASFAEHTTSPSSKNSGSKWKVQGPTPSFSYTSTTVAPVVTPSSLAAGDSSWLKSASRDEREARPEKSVGFRTDEPADAAGIEKKPAAPAPGGVTTAEPAAKPLSIVEQRRMLYNKLASESTVPPPLPDESLRSSSFKFEPDSSPRSEPKSAPAIRFSDRVETPSLTKYPISAGLTAVDLSSSAIKEGSVGSVSEGKQSDALDVTAPQHPSPSENVSTTSALKDSTAMRDEIAACSASSDQGDGSEARSEHIGNTTGLVNLGAGVTVLEDDDSITVPLKERLAAALARYRRIFKLGNKIGITSSPSFSSNRGSGISDTGTDDESTKGSGSLRAEFFARAKAVTGAWGIILTQELEEDSDTEDDSQQVTEAELQAFSRLLDFWDNRRASANISKGGEVILDDDQSSPLSEEDISQIQSLIYKLEPKQVEEEMTEVVEDVNDGGSDTNYETSGQEERGLIESLDDLDTAGLDVAQSGANAAEGAGPADSASGDILTIGSEEVDESASPAIVAESAQPSSIARPASPYQRAHEERSQFVSSPTSLPVSAAPPVPPVAPVNTTASWDRTDRALRLPPSTPPPPPPPPPILPVLSPRRSSGSLPPLSPSPPTPPPPHSFPNSRAADVATSGPAPPPPPPYAAPETSTAADNRRMVVTYSTVRDPFRPRAAPAHVPSQAPGDAHSVSFDDPRVSDAKAAIETSAALERGARAPERLSRDTEGTGSKQRKSSTHTSDCDIVPRQNGSRVSGGANSATSGTPGGSSGGVTRPSHTRSPSGDEHATRGMFTFGMFSRRKSSALTSFDSDLAPDRCLTELGRILISLDCVVHMKRGESKMKCEAPVRQDKLLLSITCAQEKKVSTVHFKRGRKDKSHVDAKEFLDFFQKVQSRFHERVGSDGRRR